MFSFKKPPTAGLEPRFAILHHALEASAGRFDHWDLMLEHDGVLVTFELERLPSNTGPFTARRLADHRLTYLEYEGHISGNRGQVVRLDRGRYREHNIDDASKATVNETGKDERPFRYELHGQRLNAIVACDQPIHLLPFGRLIHLHAVQWLLHD